MAGKNPPITLTILRGPHDLEMADYVLPFLPEHGVLFIELPGTLQQQHTFQQWANLLTLHRQPGQQNAHDEADFTINEDDGYTKLIRRLKDSNTLVHVVDEVYDKPQAISEWLELSSLIDFPMSYLETANLPAMYRSMQQKANVFAESVLKRDAIVAGQVCEQLQLLRKEYPDLPLRAALVQGYSHRSRAQIAKLMPELHITERTYNPGAVKLVEQHPLNQILEAKLAHSAVPVPQELLDRALLVVLRDLSLTSDGVDAAQFEYPTRTVTKDLRNLKSYNGKMRELKNLDAAEVHRQLILQLEGYHLKGFQKYIVPPIRLLYRTRRAFSRRNTEAGKHTG